MNQNTEQETFSNDLLQVSVTRKPHCVVELNVSVSTILAGIAYTSAIRVVSKEITLPGFRKGKAPEALIMKQYTKAIEDQWKQEIADLAFKECKELTHLSPFDTKAKVHYQLKSFSQENGAELLFSFEVEPSSVSIDPKELQVEKKEIQVVSDQDIDQTLQNILTFFAEWHPITDRGVEERDRVHIDIESLDGETPEMINQNEPSIVDSKLMPEWLFKTILDLELGASVECESIPDSDASAEDKANFPPKKVRVTLHKIEKPTFPPIDDALAKRLGVESAEELRDRLHTLLIRQRKDEMQRLRRDSLNAQLLEKYPFDLPETLIREEVHSRFQEMMGMDEFKNKWAHYSEEEKKTAIDRLKKDSEEAIRLFYLYRRVLSDAEIPITSKDFASEGWRPLDLLFGYQETTPFKQQTKEQQAVQVSRTVLSKAQDHLLNQLDASGAATV